jgi:hypothetical protein
MTWSSPPERRWTLTARILDKPWNFPHVSLGHLLLESRPPGFTRNECPTPALALSRYWAERRLRAWRTKRVKAKMKTASINTIRPSNSH